MRKRWIASILTVAMMLSVISPLSAYADDGDDVLFEDGYAQSSDYDESVDEAYNLEEASRYDTEEPGDGIAMLAATHTMDQLRQMFPAGKYWNHAGMSGNNAEGWTNTPCNHNVTTSTCNHYVRPNGQSWSSQCMGYAQELAYLYYGSDPINQPLRTDKDVVDILMPGDVVRYLNNQHSIFITAVNGEDITFSDCNYGNQCIIRWDVHITKSKLKETFTNVRLAPGNRGTIPDTCSTQYAGWYKVKSSDGISVNSGHNFHSKIGEISNGALVYVTKATGLGRSQVGHIQWGGEECYVAMNLLVRVTGIKAGHLWAGYDHPATNYPNGEVVIQGNVFDWKDLNENLQVRVVADSGQEATCVADQSRYNMLLDDYEIGTSAQKDQGANHDFEARLSGLSAGSHTIHIQVYSDGNWVEVGTVDTVMPEVYKLLKVTSYPSKTEYTVGEQLDTTGLTLKEIITLSSETVGNLSEQEITSGFTCTPTTLDTAGTQTITVNYDGQSTSFDVTVKEKETPSPTPDDKDDNKTDPGNNPTKPDPDDTTTTKPDQNEDKLEFQMRPIKTKYTVGDTLDDSGMVLKWTHQGKEELVYYGYTCTPEILDQVGTQMITVSYKGLSVKYPVEVKAKDTTSSGTTTKPSGGTTTTKPNNTVKPNDTPKPDDTVTTPSDDGSGMAAAILLGGAVVVVGGIVMMAMAATPVEVRATAISSDHAVLVNAPVALLQGDRVVAQTVTDANGQFHFNVKKGSYTLRVTTTNAETGETVTRYAAISAPANGSVVTF